MKSGGSQPEDDRRAGAAWEKPFGRGLALGLLPLTASLGVALLAVAAHIRPAGQVIALLGLAIILSEILAIYALLEAPVTLA